MQVVLPEGPARLAFVDRIVSDEAFADFCAANPDLRVERNAEGEVEIMPPAGGETEFRNVSLIAQLHTWSSKDGRGRAFGSNTDFFLPNGAARSPDAAWVSKRQIQPLSRAARRKFLRLCPDFVVELKSPSDRLRKLQDKMREWIQNGAQLGWLIDADRRTVYIYRPGREVERVREADVLRGEGPIDGFTLDLTEIWEEL